MKSLIFTMGLKGYKIYGGEDLYGTDEREFASAEFEDAGGRRSEAEVLKMDAMPSEAMKRATRLKRPSPAFDEDSPRAPHSDSYRKILSLLHRLQKHPLAGPFLQPVDLNAVPDYPEVVKEPMDLGTIEEKLMSGGYASAYEFSADVRKVWSNAFLYNAQNTELYNITVTLSAFFESIFKGHENLLLTDRHDAIEGLYKQLEALKKEIKDIKGTGKPAPPKQVVERPMTLQEKKVLGQNIRALQPQFLRGLIAIIKDSLPKDIQGTELEFDLDTLSPKVCRELERYVKQCMPASSSSVKPHSKKKPSACSFSTSQVQDINDKLEDLATGSLLPPRKDSDSESSSSSDSEEAEQPTGIPSLGMDVDMFGGGDYPSMWTNYQQQRGPADHNDGFMTGPDFL